MKTGYTWKNWTIDNTDSTIASSTTASTSVTVNATTTVTANSVANTYTVVYNPNGGTGTMANTTHTYNVSQNLRVNTFVRTGYPFKGWAISESGNVTYTDGQSVINLTSTANATINLYAVWSDESAPSTPIITRQGNTNFTYISIDPVGVTGYYVKVYDEIDLETSAYSTCLSSNKPTTSSTWLSATTTSYTIGRSGTYHVWARDAAGNISDAGIIKAFTLTIDSNVTGIESVSGAGNYLATSSTNHSYTVTIGAVAKTGYTWTGWTTVSGNAPSSNPSVTLTQNTSLKPTVNSNTYTVKFSCNGGSCPSSTTMTYDVAKQFTASKKVTVTLDKNATSATIGNNATTAEATQTFKGWTSSTSAGLNTSTAKVGRR